MEDYGDVELHFEEIREGKKVFSTKKANKVVLALYSPYFHRLFQSSKGISVFHICFVGVNNYNIVDVINLIYGHSISIPKKNVSRFENLLQKLEIDYEKESLSGNSSIVGCDSDSVNQQTCKKFKLASPPPDNTSGDENSFSSMDTSIAKMQEEHEKAGLENQEAGASSLTTSRAQV